MQDSIKVIKAYYCDFPSDTTADLPTSNLWGVQNSG